MTRQGIWACVVVGSVMAVAAAPQAAAVTSVDAIELWDGYLDVGMNDWDGDAHNVTVEPNGFVFPGRPRSVTITDTRVRLEYWPIDPEDPDCQVLSAHKVKCISDHGVSGFTAALTRADEHVSFTALPGPFGPATTMPYAVGTGSGDDKITIPVADQTFVHSHAGDDTVVAPSGWVDCGDGNDTAVGFGQSFPDPPFNCETSVPR